MQCWGASRIVVGKYWFNRQANHCHLEIRSHGFLNQDRDLLTINRAVLTDTQWACGPHLAAAGGLAGAHGVMRLQRRRLWQLRVYVGPVVWGGRLLQFGQLRCVWRVRGDKCHRRRCRRRQSLHRDSGQEGLCLLGGRGHVRRAGCRFGRRTAVLLRRAVEQTRLRIQSVSL